MIPIEGHSNLFRDENSGAIINCDTTEYNNYITSKQNYLNQKKEIENLKFEISDIKTLLTEILNETRGH